MLVEFLGTGFQAAVPPSSHPSGERRGWDADGEPAELSMQELWDAVHRLALACGWEPTVKTTRPKKTKAKKRRREGDRLVSLPEQIRRGRQFIEVCPLARSGQGGHATTYRVARYLRNDLALPDDVGRTLLDAYNERLAAAGEERWTAEELDHKWEDAAADNPDYPFGDKAAAPPAPVHDPHRLARLFLATHPFRYWNGLYWEHDGKRYREVPERELCARLNLHIRECFDAEHDEQMRRYKQALRQCPAEGRPPRLPMQHSVTSTLVSNTLHALECFRLVDGTVPMPSHLREPGEGDWLALDNGLLDLESQELRPHTTDWFSAVCLPYAYDPAARCDSWLEVLGQNLEGDAERLGLLQEFFGYTLIGSTDAQMCLVLVGEGGNGKSVVLAGLHALLGADNVSTVPLEDFGGRFAMAQTLGKLANICAEVGELDRTAEGTLKAFVSGDRMSFERKGKDGFSARPTARLVLSTNNVPRFADRSEGVWRRLLLVPFNRRVPSSERRPGLDKPEFWLCGGELPGMLNWALEGLRRQRANNFLFTLPAACRAALEAHRLESDPCRAFLVEHYKADPKAGPLASAEVYQHYKKWCEENGHKAVLAASNFGKQVRRVFKLEESRTKRFPTDGKSEPAKAWSGLARRSVTDVTLV
jgi:P4 family phage/plasmid primase-like protien